MTAAPNSPPWVGSVSTRHPLPILIAKGARISHRGAPSVCESFHGSGAVASRAAR